MFTRRYGDTDFITGLRAIAALMVIAVHTDAFRAFGAIGDNLTDNGKYGVQVFFVIAGFTVAANIRRMTSTGEFIIRRLFRIAPLYYVATSIAFAMIAVGYLDRPYWMERYGAEADIYNLAMHVTFLSGWDVNVANSLIGTEWTIPVEIFWYLALPLLLPALAEWWKAAVSFIGLILLAIASWLITDDPNAARFMPTSYGAYFLLGALCFNMRGRAIKVPGLACVGAGVFCLVLVLQEGFATPVIVSLATAAIILGHNGKGALVSPAILFLGSISYSIYIWHMLVIAALPIKGEGVVWFAIVTVLTVALSMVSYITIERPSNFLGRTLSKRRKPVAA